MDLCRQKEVSRATVPVSLLVGLCLLVADAAVAQASFTFLDVTDLPGGPGAGDDPQINSAGDIAFADNILSTVWLWKRDTGSFLELTALPGAPVEGGWAAKINSAGNVAFLGWITDEIWFYEAATGTLGNLADLAGYPGVSENFEPSRSFDLNDLNQISFHVGDRNGGHLYVYRHADGSFARITGQPGRPAIGGRENTINNASQIAFLAVGDIYLHTLGGATTNLTDLPGGPGTPSFQFNLNDRGDLAIFRSDEVIYLEAATSSWLYLSTLPNFPSGAAARNHNDLSDRGEMVFWRDGMYYFEPTGQSFTRLDGQNGVPDFGDSATINDRGEIAFTAGSDVYLAIPVLFEDGFESGDTTRWSASS